MTNLNIFKMPYKTKYFLLFILILSLAKVVLFSLTIQTPATLQGGRLLNNLLFVLSNTGILLFLLSFMFLLPSRFLQVSYGIFIHVFVSIFITGSRIYNLFFNSYFSVETILHSQDAMTMTKSLFSTVSLRDLFWLIDVPIILFFAYKYWYKKPSQGQYNKPRHFVVLLVISLIALLVVFNIQTERHFLPMVNIKGKGLLSHYTQEAVHFLRTGDKAEINLSDVNKIKSWFLHNRRDAGEGDYFGLAEDKNLILLQVEALQNHVIHKRIKGQEITPNLNRIMGESIYFDNFYDQVDMATADAEALVNLSLYPLPDVSPYMAYPENTYNSLANQLKEKGYTTAAFHGFERNFYNREEAYPNMGFEKYFSRRHYEQDEVYNELLGDKTFLRQTADMLKELEEPYYAFIITLTSHHPFTYLEDYHAIDVGDYEGTIVGDYIKSIHYTDAAVGEFYERLSREGILDDSLLVIYGDHVAFNYNEIDQEALTEFFDVEDIQNPLERIRVHKVPMAIRLPNKEKTEVISDNSGMIDIFPTVANLMGFRNDYLMGRDLLNSEESTVILKGGSFVDGNNLFSAINYYKRDLDTGEKELLADDNELIKKVRETRIISELIYRTDFFANK